MLDLKSVAQNFDQVVARLRSRGGNLDLGPFQKRFQERRELRDLGRGARVGGSRFVSLRGARGGRGGALVSFFIAAPAAGGYTELLPPYLVTRESMTGTGQLPKFEEDAFKTAGADERFLI